MKIHHFGYAVKSIEKSIPIFELLGYTPHKDEYIDNERMIKIRFIEKNGTTLELIEPIDDNSPVKGIIKKSGEGIYHTCYISSDYKKDIDNLLYNGFIVIQESKEAIALSNREVIFMYKNGLGLIEIINDENISEK